MLEKKDYVSLSKGVHKQNLQLAKVFVTCKKEKQRKTAFKEKHPNINIGFSNFVPRDQNSEFWLAQK